MGLNILAADHQHFCFCPVSPTATEENPVCQEDSPESIHRTIAHNRVLHSCIYSMKGSTKQTTNTSQTLSCGQPCLQTACSWQRPSYAGLSPRFQVAVNTTSRWEIKQLGVSFVSIFLLLSFESGWEPPLNDNPVMGSEVMHVPSLNFKSGHFTYWRVWGHVTISILLLYLWFSLSLSQFQPISMLL